MSQIRYHKLNKIEFNFSITKHVMKNSLRKCGINNYFYSVLQTTLNVLHSIFHIFQDQHPGGRVLQQTGRHPTVRRANY